MLSVLTEKHKKLCNKGVEYGDEENGIQFETNYRKYNKVQISESYLIVETGNIRFSLDLVNFSEEWLKNLIEYDSCEQYEDGGLASDILTLDTFYYKDENRLDDDLLVSKTYGLSVVKTKDGYKLSYGRVRDDESNDFDGEVEQDIVTDITLKELKVIAELDCPLEIGDSYEVEDINNITVD